MQGFGAAGPVGGGSGELVGKELGAGGLGTGGYFVVGDDRLEAGDLATAGGVGVPSQNDRGGNDGRGAELEDSPDRKGSEEREHGHCSSSLGGLRVMPATRLRCSQAAPAM